MALTAVVFVLLIGVASAFPWPPSPFGPHKPTPPTPVWFDQWTATVYNTGEFWANETNTTSFSIVETFYYDYPGQRQQYDVVSIYKPDTVIFKELWRDNILRFIFPFPKNCTYTPVGFGPPKPDWSKDSTYEGYTYIVHGDKFGDYKLTKADIWTKGSPHEWQDPFRTYTKFGTSVPLRIFAPADSGGKDVVMDYYDYRQYEPEDSTFEIPEFCAQMTPASPEQIKNSVTLKMAKRMQGK